MKTKNYPRNPILKTFISLLLVIATCSSVMVFGQNGQVKMVYNYPTAKTVSYNMSTAISQVMDIQGQTINVMANTDLAYKVKLLEKQGDNLKLEIGIDSMSYKSESMGGSIGGKLKEVEGKTFNMIIAPNGKTVDAAGASKVEYTIEGQGNLNLASQFSNIFPTLTDKTIKQGDTWEKNDTITQSTAVSKTTMMIKSANKLEGIETINGSDCAKIVSTITGTMQVNAQNQGMDIFMSGTLQGQSVVWFAFKEGYFMKQEVSQKMNGTAEISGPQSMSFPITIETTSKSAAK
jgi:hypothetical protein